MNHTMKQCILAQPQTIRDVIAGAPEQMRILDSAVGRGPYSKIFMVGSGTSLHAAMAAKYALLRWTQAEVQLFTPFEFLNYGPHNRLDNSALVLGISQTARSIGTINCVELSRKRGAKTVFVTAEPDNPGASCAHVVLNTCTGLELVGAKTKGFTSAIAMLYFLAAWLGGAKLDLSAVPVLMEETLKRTEAAMRPLAEEYRSAPSVTVLGGGPLSAAAREGGLKILEGIRIPTEVYDVEEYMHGPYHCLEKGSHLIFLADEGPGLDRALRMIAFAQDHSEHVLVIGDEQLSRQMEFKCQFLALPPTPELLLTPLYYTIPLQWLSNDATLLRGRRPEQSRYPEFHGVLGSKYMPKINYYNG